MAEGFSFNASSNNDYPKVVIPDNRYPATFKGYDIIKRVNKTTKEEEDRIVWKFEIQGKTSVVEIAGFTSTKWGGANKPSMGRKWMAALQNLKPSSEEIIRDLDKMKDRQCYIQTDTYGEGDAAQSSVKEVYPFTTEDEIPF